MTGFRLRQGGASERFGVKPDLATFGKIIGGGFACGAVAGIKEVMDVFAYPPAKNSVEIINPLIPHPGTYNDHKIPMVAGLSTLNELGPDLYRSFREGGENANRPEGIVPRRWHKNGDYWNSVVFHIHFTDKEIFDMRSAQLANSLLIRHYDLNMANLRINLAKAHASFCSTPLTATDVDQTLKAAKETLTAMKPLISQVAPNLVM